MTAATEGMERLPWVVLAVAYAWAVVELVRQGRCERGPDGTRPRGDLVVLQRPEGPPTSRA